MNPAESVLWYVIGIILGLYAALTAMIVLVMLWKMLLMFIFSL